NKLNSAEVEKGDKLKILVH
ncbi:hypothetical protein EVA_22493, partial [gut metagenome]